MSVSGVVHIKSHQNSWGSQRVGTSDSATLGLWNKMFTALKAAGPVG